MEWNLGPAVPCDLPECEDTTVDHSRRLVGGKNLPTVAGQLRQPGQLSVQLPGASARCSSTYMCSVPTYRPINSFPSAGIPSTRLDNLERILPLLYSSGRHPCKIKVKIIISVNSNRKVERHTIAFKWPFIAGTSLLVSIDGPVTFIQ